MRVGVGRGRHWTGMVLAGAAVLAFGAMPGVAAPHRPARQGLARRAVERSARLVSLSVAPAAVTMRGAGARQHVLVTGRFADGSERDLTREARYAVQGKAARLAGPGVVVADQDGKATLTVQVARLRGRAVVAGEAG